ncbi:hypothetical protein JW980_06375 [Acinetobacter johnsonii]|uniref:hypothetical protein n=1 Tax=Acinetobacter johnsonii TaxID=40214 RepID=UPI00196AD0B0|nr:hypothetical protein [Acinetobacter johnsonii]QSE46996.1 hypothetical protein JW980_06375 [Acinetobacter johnsonii]
MDIQKEREAFEKHASKFFTDSKEAFKTNGDQYLYDEVIWMWDCWIERAKAQAVPEGFVLVPKECPDPIFADKLFDHLCEKAHGEFGDDQMIFFSDIDESAIWQLMIDEASQ